MNYKLGEAEFKPISIAEITAFTVFKKNYSFHIGALYLNCNLLNKYNLI